MSLGREQLLAEMGLTPQWKLREQPSVARDVKKMPTCNPISVTPPVVSEMPLQSDSHAVPPLLVTEGRADQLASVGWAELRQSIAECRACSLCTERQLVVPGVGDEQADWLFIGEGPGAEEDEQGEPFVGQAGRLLDAMLLSIDLKRGNNVYITNVMKCHATGNRAPKEAEIAACTPYLKRQIALLQPKLIVLLGRVAVHALLGEDVSLASLRGQPVVYRNGEQSIPVIVTYHPAYLLRTLPDKAKSWEDLCRARQLMSEILSFGIS